MIEPQTQESVPLDSTEVMLILSAMNRLTGGDEIDFNLNPKDLNQLYNKLYSVWERLDKNQKIRNSILCDV
jgi:hypothetical protein